MSRSYWLSLCAAVGLGLAVPVHAQPKGGAQSLQTAPQHGKNGPTAKPGIVFPTADIKRIARALEAANRKPQPAEEPKYAGEYLQAQKNMAFWASCMFWVALFEAVVTLAGVILVRYTLVAARDSAREAKRAADEAKRQADTAENTLAQTRLATETELRAWVDVEAELTRFKSGMDHIYVGIKVRVKNVGQTPALNVATSQTVRPASSFVNNGGGLPATEKYPNAMPSLMPGKEAEQSFGLSFSVQEANKCISECKGSVTGKSALMVVADVIAYYRTILDKPDAPLRMTSIRYYIYPRDWAEPFVDDSRDWVRSITIVDAVKLVHAKSAPVYMT